MDWCGPRRTSNEPREVEPRPRRKRRVKAPTAAVSAGSCQHCVVAYTPPTGFVQFTGERPTGYRFHLDADCTRIKQNGHPLVAAEIPGANFRCRCVRRGGVTAIPSERDRPIAEVPSGFESSRRRH